MCSRVAVSQQGFAKASEHLKHLAQLSVSYERLRQIVEFEGQLVLEVQRKGLLAAEFSVQDCKTSPKGPKRLYVGTDGVMVPMVTEAEKDKRRKARGPKRTGSRRRRMHKGADNAYKEFKIATFYNESNERRQVIATSGNHEVLGKLLAREAKRLKMTDADQKTEGANAEASMKVFEDMFGITSVKREDFEAGIGRGAEAYIRAAAEVHGLEMTSEQVEQATRMRQENFLRILREKPLAAFSGVLELMASALARDDFEVAIATSSTREKSEAVLQSAKIPYEQMAYVTGDQVKNKKPDPLRVF